MLLIWTVRLTDSQTNLIAFQMDAAGTKKGGRQKAASRVVKLSIDDVSLTLATDSLETEQIQMTA